MVPEITTCRCGTPAGHGQRAPAAPGPAVPFKTPMEYLRQCRTQAEGDALVDEALRALRAARKH